MASSLPFATNPEIGEATKSMEEPNQEPKFFPRGAVFFFVLLLLFYAALWFVIYGIMILRS